MEEGGGLTLEKKTNLKSKQTKTLYFLFERNVTRTLNN